MSFSNAKKLICALVFVLFALICVTLFVAFAPEEIIAEETEEDFLNVCEEYTNRKSFIGSDGKAHTVKEFADKVRKTNSGTIADLDKVIPKQCLKDAPAGTIYQYCGSVYGFVTHHFEYTTQITFKHRAIQVLLYEVTDISEKVNDDRDESGIQIKQLCSANFAPKNGGVSPHSIVHQTEVKEFLHIANVGFSNYCFNENLLNCGDTNYNKKNDRGAYIKFTRLNYSGDIAVLGSSAKDSAAKIAVNTALGCIPYIGGGDGSVSTQSEFQEKFVCYASESEQISRNYETTVLNNGYFHYQENDDSYPSFIRATTVKPQDTIYFNDTGYANCFVEFGYLNPACRLYQMVSFDVAMVHEDVFSTKIKDYLLSGDDCISVTHERKLFRSEEYKPLEFNETTFAYSLAGGEDIFSFTPKLGGTYQITVSGKVGVQAVLDAQNTTANDTHNVLTAHLQEGVCYRLRTFSDGQCGQYTVKVTLQDFKLEQPNTIQASRETLRLRCSRSGAYAITSDSQYAKYFLYDEQLNRLESFTGDFEYYFDATKTYYLHVVNSAFMVQPCNVFMAPVGEVAVDETVTDVGDGTWKWYRITPHKEGNYTLSVLRAEYVDIRGAIILSQKNFSSGKTMIDFVTFAGQEVYVGIKFEGSYEFTITET